MPSIFGSSRADLEFEAWQERMLGYSEDIPDNHEEEIRCTWCHELQEAPLVRNKDYGEDICEPCDISTRKDSCDTQKDSRHESGKSEA